MPSLASVVVTSCGVSSAVPPGSSSDCTEGFCDGARAFAQDARLAAREVDDGRRASRQRAGVDDGTCSCAKLRRDLVDAPWLGLAGTVLSTAYTIFNFNDEDCTAAGTAANGAGQGDHVFAIFLQQGSTPTYWIAGQDPSMCSEDGDCNLTLVKVRRSGSH